MAKKVYSIYQMNTSALRSWIEIDLRALEENVRKIKASLPEGTAYIAVVKANAYGHCMPQSLGHFIKGGADMFAVANMYEVSRIRELVSNVPVLLLSPVLSSERKLVFEYDAIPAISTTDEALDFDGLARLRSRVLEVHVKVDTGMGRYGVWHENAADFLKEVSEYKNLRITGIFTHFSSADTDQEYTKIQAQNFKRVLDSFDSSNLMVHMHNSAGLNYFAKDFRCNGVRIGLLEYGISPYGDSRPVFADVTPVLSFKARISSVADTASGRIASVSAGYADGVPLGFTPEARVLVGGKRRPVLGNVGLDETLVDINDGHNVKAGDEVVFIGRQGDECIDLPSYSRWTKRIPWETMVSIPRRVEKILILK